MKLSKEEMGILKDFIWAIVDDAIDKHEHCFHNMDENSGGYLRFNQEMFDKTFMEEGKTK